MMSIATPENPVQDESSCALQPGGTTEATPAADQLWPQDCGTLPLDARTALLQLVRGPYINETRDAKLWAALMTHRTAIASQLANLFLDLTIDEEAGVAFARNATSEDRDLPRAARTNTMTLLDSIMVLTLRRELLLACGNRVFVDQDELFEALAQYRNLNQLDPASYRDRLKTSWNRLVEMRILLKGEADDRYEISPVLKIIFGAEEAQAVSEAFEGLLASSGTEPDSEKGSADER